MVSGCVVGVVTVNEAQAKLFILAPESVIFVFVSA
jgi:hypothetical protein